VKLAPIVVVISLAAVAASLAGCSINHRTGEFSCDKQADCAVGRSCIDGFCVLPDDAGIIDGPHADAAVCPSACTSCDLAQKSCTIDCALNGGCKQQVVCPTGYSCQVLCSRDGACSSGVSCLGSTSCSITCSGGQSCRGLSCGLGPCNVACTGNASCGEVNCGSSCACDVACSGIALCRNLTCKPTCNIGTRGCTSLAGNCNTCR
jgi:hypothetical protein